MHLARLGRLFQRKSLKRSVLRLVKPILHRLRPGCGSTPVFIFGKQRSGTTMLTRILDLCAWTLVYDESRDSTVFEDFRVRSWKRIDATLESSKAPLTVYKTITDSHLIEDFVVRYPGCKCLWMMRNYRDVANSTQREFPHTHKAFRRLCIESSRKRWSEEGVSRVSQEMVEGVFRPDLSPQDLLCLQWWTRNRLIVEKELCHWPNVLLIDYDKCVQNKLQQFGTCLSFSVSMSTVTHWLGLLQTCTPGQ